MSRAGDGAAAVAQSSSTATFLVLRDDPTRARVMSAPLNSNGYPVELGALVMLLGLSEYSNRERIKNRKEYLDREQLRRKKVFSGYEDFTSHGGGIFKITSYLVWARVLNFLLHNNAMHNVPSIIADTRFSCVTNALNFIPHDKAFPCASLVIAREHIPNPYERLTALTNRLQDTKDSSNTTLNASFFSKNYQAGFEFATLLDAALNADLPIVEKMLNEASPANRQIFLSSVGKATITHLGIERTGTPLQMALYSHDEKMVEVIKRYMDPQEFQHQCEAVFGSDHNVFVERQEVDATRLCSELENAFRQALPTDVTNALNHVANTTSALQDVLSRFKNNLERYVSQNAVHNPYILQRLFEIYDNLPYDWNKLCLFSEQPIGLTEKLSSAIWLSHISDGIYNLGKNDSPVKPSRGFLTQNSARLDVRSLDLLGVNCCIDLFGGPAVDVHTESIWPVRACLLQNLCRTKTTDFQNLLPGDRGSLTVA